MWLDKQYNKNKEEVIRKAEEEAENIFMKNQPWIEYKKWNQKWMTWTYPKVKDSNMWTKYSKRANKVTKQVVDTRLKQFKNKDSK